MPSKPRSCRITQVACCHLYADMMKRGIFAGVEVGAMQFYAPLLTQADDKPFVTVRLFAPQVEITMCGLYVVTQVLQQQQQCHAVSPAAQRYQVPAITSQQLVLGYVSSNP